jgi:hypothetical protein
MRNLFNRSRTEIRTEPSGAKAWYRNGQRHRNDGPAVEYPDGTREWYLYGEIHRPDGPAVEFADGGKVWYLHGQRHRNDGPAVEYPDGTKMWYLHGQLHRRDGPAIERASGVKAWYIEGQCLTAKEAEEIAEVQTLRQAAVLALIAQSRLPTKHAMEKTSLVSSGRPAPPPL